MLWNCVPVVLKVVRAIIADLIRAATLNEARYVFLCVFMKQSLWHCRRSSALAIKPTRKKDSRLRRENLSNIAQSGEVLARRDGFLGDSARNAAKTRQVSDPKAVVNPMARSTGICERANTPNTKIVVVLHTTNP